MSGKQRSLHRIGTMPAEEFLAIVKEHIINPDGTLNYVKERTISCISFKDVAIKLNSQRYQTFLISGIVCVTCGLEGIFFGVEAFSQEKDKGYYHMNLYAIKDGEEILMTKDHILPKSKGGKNTISNYQTMCIVCNVDKGNKTK